MMTCSGPDARPPASPRRGSRRARGFALGAPRAATALPLVRQLTGPAASTAAWASSPAGGGCRSRGSQPAHRALPARAAAAIVVERATRPQACRRDRRRPEPAAVDSIVATGRDGVQARSMFGPDASTPGWRSARSSRSATSRIFPAGRRCSRPAWRRRVRPACAAPAPRIEALVRELAEHAVGIRVGQVDLVHGDDVGTSAARICEIDSRVCGITPSSAATTRTAMSVTFAPQAI